MDDQIHWKTVWQMVSGLHQDTPKEKVKAKLLELKEELKQGLLHFKPSSSNSDSKLDKLLKDAGQEKLLPLTKYLQKYLNLDANQTWSTLCTYLVNEYKGSPNSLASFVVANEANKLKLITDIWNYYSLDRMIILKLTKNLLEFQREKRHPYQEVYAEVVESIGLRVLRDKVIDQLTTSLKDDVEYQTLSSLDQQHEMTKLDLLFTRKLREINELIQILILIGHTEGNSVPEELNMLLNVFKNSAFLQKCKYQSEGNIGQLLQRIEHSKVILLLLFIQNSPQNTVSWNAKVFKDIDETITTSHQHADSGPILLAWMVKNLKALALDETLNDSINSRNYQQCGAKAIKLEVFKYLLALLTSRPFQSKPPSLLAITARQLVYKILNEMCDLFDADGSVAQHNFIYDLVAELLTTPSISVDFMKDSSRGCASLYNTAIELFPVTMIPISKIASALASSGTKNGSEFIKSQLEQLPVYTELCAGNQYDLQSIASDQSEDEFLLTKDYFPMRKFNYKIGRGTRVAMTDRRKVTYVHFWSPCNYFQVLQNDIQILLSMGMAGDPQDSEENAQLIARVTCGVKYLRDMLKKLKSPAEITDSMVHPVEMVFDILLKFKTLPNPPIALLSSCLEVCTALSSFFREEVLRRMINLDIFPSVSSHTLSHEEYARGAAFDPGLIGQYLINFENANGSYSFLKAYFGFLKAYKLNKANVFAVELPGLIFLLREIFPHCHTWRFERESDLHEIYTFVMEFFFELLQSEDKTTERTLLRNTCVYSLLNLENGLTLLKFVGIGNPFLQSKMESESNWVAAIDSGLNTIVQLSMTILMQILRKKNILSAGQQEGTALANALSPLETIIYTQPKQRDTLRIIPVVTSYMNNIFNRRLPILSCRLLRRFALEFQMSLLACLDMEQDHIRMIFLQRLRDESGSNELKIAILEFVEACLDKQPGLVEAFFDIQYDPEKRKPKMHTEGIPAYMEEYLAAVSREPEKVASPLLSRIMSLFHVVWRNNMQSLIGNLIESKTFWPSLCKPLFVKISGRSLKVYSQLFNILGLEVFKYQESDLSPELEGTLKKFLELSSFETWLKYLLDSDSEETPMSSDETPEWLCRMQSFKDFLCIVLKKKPDLMSSRARCVLLNRLVIEILKRIEECQLGRSDSRSMVILSELYLLVLVGNESQKYTDTAAEDKRLFHDMATILSFLASSYEDVIPRVREAILGSTVEIALTYNAELSAYPDIGTHFMQSTLAIISQELGWLENGISEGQSKVALLLALSLLRKLLLINNESRLFDWESVSTGHKILYRFLGTLSKIGQQYADRKVTLEILEVQTIMARTLETNDFLYCDIGDYLWLKLLPPKSLLRDPFEKSKQKAIQPEWMIQDWWPIYAKGIELVTVLLDKHGSLFVQHAITFLGIHEEYLMDSMNLVRESLEPRAMELIKKTVALICECAKYRKTWQLEHSQSICNLMRSVQILTEQLISLLYRPNLLKMLLGGRPNDNALVDLSAPISATPELIQALNGVIEIIIMCIKALMCFTPPLIELICSPTFTPAQWHVLIEIQFGAPKFNDSVQPLSFGTLLSAAGTFTKALALMHYSFQETPLNFQNEEDCEKDNSTVNVTSPKSPKTVNMSTTATARAMYNKTLSVSSYGNQSLANFNEIFSNLDGKLCLVALEYIYTLVISQSFLAIKDAQLSLREKQLIKRELGAELSKLNDFLKHKLSLDKVGSLQRKKYGIYPILNHVEDQEEAGKTGKPISSASSQRRLSQPRDSMRVNVVRKLHLKQKVLPMVQGSTPRRDDNQPVAAFENLTPIKKTCYEDTEYMNVEDPTDVGLSVVKIVEEDYLHMLSNLISNLSNWE